jgi:hypothetical protein
MSTSPATSRGKAIHATPDFVKVGEGVSKNFGFLRHLAICTTAGIALGLVWKVRLRPSK